MAADGSIPRSNHRRNKKLVPWWTEECRLAVKNRNRAFKLVKNTHNMQHLIQYKKAQANVRRTVRQAKRASWRKFCNEIGRSTPVGEVWGMIKRMGGVRREWEIPVIITEEGTAISNKDKAEIMAKAFVKIHSSDNLSEVCKMRKERTMNQHPGVLDWREKTDDKIDEPFNMAELKRAINKAKPTSPGKDQICYVMLKHLGKGALLKLLHLYNRVWEEGRLPNAWKEAVVIPIRKPGKDPSKPTSYRPIALTSNVCKIMERMITERLSYTLEKSRKLANYQSGFRKGRSTMDSVIRLENEIRKAQANKESVITVFFDIEKAYDMMWKEGLLIKLHLMDVSGRVFNWIKNFLFGRKIEVRIGSDISSQFDVGNGTPQGSVISPLLFIIMIDDVFTKVPMDIGRSLFADDGALWKRGRNMEHAIRKVQGAIDEVVEWGYDWGFKFSIEKTQTVFFTKKQIKEGMKLNMYGKELERVGTFKCLGVIFDSRLTWADHIKKIEGKCKKVINVMRCLTGREWGASCSALKTIYLALIRSVLDYGSVAYGSAAKSLLKKLDRIQAQALRVCSGAFKTSPVPALQVEMGEMQLALRRRQLMTNYWANLQGHNDFHPTKEVLQETWENARYNGDNFSRIGNEVAREFGVFYMEMSPTVVYPIVAPWLLVWPDIDWYLLELKRKEKDQIDLVNAFKYLINKDYKEFVHVYTDGSKKPETGVTGYGVAIPAKGIGINRRTSDFLGVYTVEMVAVLVALRWVEKTRQEKVLICSDSSSVLESLRSFHSKSRQDVLYEVLQSVTRITNQGGRVQFMWVPAHVGVKGNEQVDELAKRALKKGNIEMQIKISKAEVKSFIWEKTNQIWQERWDREEKGRHLYQIQKSVKITRLGGGHRREETVMTRLRLGHGALNKSLKMIGKHETGLCEWCQEEESVEHIIIRCRRYEVQRVIMRNNLRELGVQELTFKRSVEHRWQSTG